jgi:hypothetical protein
MTERFVFLLRLKGWHEGSRKVIGFNIGGLALLCFVGTKKWALAYSGWAKVVIYEKRGSWLLFYPPYVREV